MSRKSTSLCLMACMCLVGRAQDQSPKLLREASHCLVVDKKDWLGLHGTGGDIAVGYELDGKSDPGVNHLYVVVYRNAERSKGDIFDFRYREKKGATMFDLQNNASFVKSSKGVTFLQPPLGGTWTQTRLQDAITQAARKPSVTLTVSDLSTSFPGVTCTSYAEKR